MQEHIRRLTYITNEIEEAEFARKQALKEAADAEHKARERAGRICDLTREKEHLERLLSASQPVSSVA